MVISRRQTVSRRASCRHRRSSRSNSSDSARRTRSMGSVVAIRLRSSATSSNTRASNVLRVTVQIRSPNTFNDPRTEFSRSRALVKICWRLGRPGVRAMWKVRLRHRLPKASRKNAIWLASRSDKPAVRELAVAIDAVPPPRPRVPAARALWRHGRGQRPDPRRWHVRTPRARQGTWSASPHSPVRRRPARRTRRWDKGSSYQTANMMDRHRGIRRQRYDPPWRTRTRVC
jgi:hypothetical protein